MSRNKKQDKSQVPLSELGKLPPQDIDYEIYILSNILTFPDLFSTVFNILGSSECFYKMTHQIIYQTMIDMSEKEIPIDVNTVVYELRSNNKIDEVGGPYNVTLIMTKQFSSANLKHYCYVIFELYVRRKMIELFTSQTSKLYDFDSDIFEIYKIVEESLDEVFEKLTSTHIKHMKSSVQKTIDEIKAYSSGEQLSFVKTNISLFDANVYLSPKFILCIAAPRAAGKTRFLIYLMKNMFQLNGDNVAALWCSFEDSDTKIIRSFAATNTSLTDSQMQSKGYKLSSIEMKSLEKEIKSFENLDIEFINEQIDMASISRNFNRFIKKRKDKINFLIIDNIMLLDDLSNTQGPTLSVEDKISSSMRKIISRTDNNGYKTIIIFLHHMTKDLESKSNIEEAYRPRLVNLKGSSRFADVANGVILISNPGMHKDLVKKHSQLPDIKCRNSDGTFKYVKRDTLLRNMIIAEAAKNRDGEIADDDIAIQRFIVDFGKMKFNELICQK